MSQYNTDFSDSDAFLSCEEGDSDISVTSSPTVCRNHEPTMEYLLSETRRIFHA